MAARIIRNFKLTVGNVTPVKQMLFDEDKATYFKSVMLTSDGSNAKLRLVFGDSSAEAILTDTPILPGAILTLSVRPSECYISVIAESGTTNVLDVTLIEGE